MVWIIGPVFAMLLPGNASQPHAALDPIPVACEIVQALQTMVTRTIDVFDPSVVTVGRISAGTTNNVIPETAYIEGTIRAVSERTRTKVRDGIRRVAEGVAAAHDAREDLVEMNLRPSGERVADVLPVCDKDVHQAAAMSAAQ